MYVTNLMQYPGPWPPGPPAAAAPTMASARQAEPTRAGWPLPQAGQQHAAGGYGAGAPSNVQHAVGAYGQLPLSHSMPLQQHPPLAHAPAQHQHFAHEQHHQQQYFQQQAHGQQQYYGQQQQQQAQESAAQYHAHPDGVQPAFAAHARYPGVPQQEQHQQQPWPGPHADAYEGTAAANRPVPPSDDRLRAVRDLPPAFQPLFTFKCVVKHTCMAPCAPPIAVPRMQACRPQQCSPVNVHAGTMMPLPPPAATSTWCSQSALMPRTRATPAWWWRRRPEAARQASAPRIVRHQKAVQRSTACA